jgi:cysteine-rich repeat protein
MDWYWAQKNVTMVLFRLQAAMGAVLHARMRLVGSVITTQLRIGVFVTVCPSFSLFLVWFAANCGDGRVYGNEKCDDFVNTGNGCLNCQIQTGWICPDNGTQSVCSRMLFLLFSSYSYFLSLFFRWFHTSFSLLAICGDGLVLGSEQCDDGRRPPVSGDGCSQTCQNETGWTCPYDANTSRSVCSRMLFTCFCVHFGVSFLSSHLDLFPDVFASCPSLLYRYLICSYLRRWSGYSAWKVWRWH